LFRSSPNIDGFYTFYISQGSVATQLRYGGMFSNYFTTNLFFTECTSKKILKIGRQHLAKIWTKLCGLLFWGHPVVLWTVIKHLVLSCCPVLLFVHCYCCYCIFWET